jgi:hypothetical protein
MPQANKTSHHLLTQTNIKYQTFDSPASEDIMWQDGRNLWINPRGYTERRPGFSIPLESSPSVLSGTVQRLFSWRRWNDSSSGATAGHFYVMAAVVNGTASNVYKLDVGVDPSFVLLHTSYGTDPYDFVTSNNFVYFSNGVDNFMWDGTTVQTWGITSPATAPVVAVHVSSSTSYTSRPSRYSNAGAFLRPESAWDGTTATSAWKQVANVTSTLECTWEGFSPVPGTVSALTLNVSSDMSSSTASTPSTTVEVLYSLDGGQNYTSIYKLTGQGSRTQTLDSVSLSPSTDLSLLRVKAAIYDQHDHAASINVYEIYVTATSAATTSAFTGYSYCYTYGDSTTGHESSPSYLSVDTGVVNADYMNVSVIASTNPRVNQIRIYRNTDGGSTDPVQMQEITGSPFPNTTATYADSTTDVNLGLRVAPAAYRNDPPKPMRGLIRSEISGRLCGASGHFFYYSGQEEIGFGVPEESWPGGLDGNYRPMGQEIGGISDLPAGPIILLPDKIINLQGDTLDTFRWKKIADRRGSRELSSVTSSEGLAMWRDTSGKLFASDGTEFGFAIRDRIQTIPEGSLFIAVHTGDAHNWICVLDASSGLMYTYDVDQDQWNVPWTVAATTIQSCEISAGTYSLLASIGGTIYKMVENSYRDAGFAYPAWGIENLWPLAPGEHPDYVGSLDYVSLETGFVLPSSVKILTDDSTDTAVQYWTDITSGAVAAHRRTQGRNMLETWYPAAGLTAECRRISIRLDWPTSATNFFFYTQDVGYHPAGG